MLHKLKKNVWSGRNVLFAGILLGCHLAMPVHAFAEGEKVVVAIVLSQSLPPYQAAEKYCREIVSSGNDRVHFVTYNLEKDQGALDATAKEIAKAAPQLLIALGTRAALFARQYFTATPQLFSMVLYPVDNGVVPAKRSANDLVSGVSLEVSVSSQMAAIREMLPTVKTVGFVYDSVKKAAVYQDVDQAARREGLTVIAEPIASATEAFKGITNMLGQADILWASVDELIYNVQSAKPILLETLRRKKPFMAFSSSYVKAGALLALECDYEDIGKQTGEMALMVLSGTSPADIPIAFPRKTRLFLNKRTAGLIGVTIAPDFYDKAEAVFGEE